MMMRSMPPASSALADRPMPAPPPMMGSPRAILARKRFRMAERELSCVIGEILGLIYTKGRKEARHAWRFIMSPPLIGFDYRPPPPAPEGSGRGQLGKVGQSSRRPQGFPP